MQRRAHTARRGNGFSLVEVIVIVVVAGLLGALVVSLLDTPLTRSGNAATTASQAGQAEAALEAVVAYYTNQVNTSTTGVLDNVTNHYNGNATLSFSRSTFNSVDTLTVTATVGQSTLKTMLTQERTNSGDSQVSY